MAVFDKKAIVKEIHAQAGLAVVVSIWEQTQKDDTGRDELVGWRIVRTINYSEPN